jgi:F-type H+-transporting ATPase subunit epsilon
MKLSVEIMTPERVVSHGEADSVVIPAADGELGILPQHAPLVAQLQPGEIRIRNGSDVRHLSVSGGFVEVQSDRVVIMAEAAEMAQEIDEERARQAAERARDAMRSAAGEKDLSQMEAQLKRALARLHVAQTIRRKQR